MSAIAPGAPVEPATAARIRARQLQAVGRLTPLAMGANALNVVLVLWAVQTAGVPVALWWWAGAVSLVALRGMGGWWRQHRRTRKDTASLQALHRATLHAVVLALLWAAMPVILFPGGGHDLQLLVASVTTGMICAGGFALATVPVAGTASSPQPARRSSASERSRRTVSSRRGPAAGARAWRGARAPTRSARPDR